MNVFYSGLNRSDNKETDYAHAKDIWQMINVQTLDEYQDLYLLYDVLLLTNVFENFCDISVTIHELETCHFYSTSHYTWNAMLKMTDFHLELLTDIDKHLFMEKGTQRGIAIISNR